MALNCVRLPRIISQNTFRYVALSTHRNQSTATNEQLVITDVNSKTGFATVSFNRPSALNSFTLELLQDFNKALDEIENKKYKGMILTGVMIYCEFSQFLLIDINFSELLQCVHSWT